jgi:phytoene dehydrogenase-like protein
MAKKIIIIGGGMAGLSAGCYGRMNGYDTELFEMHSGAGGVCTGWIRKGYTFDGCLHWLTGSAPTSPLYAVWQELGAIKDRKITNHEAFCHVVTPSGRRLVQWGNLDRLFEELKRIGPEDAALLEQLKADARMLGTLKIPVGAPRRVSLLKKLKFLRKYKTVISVFRRYEGMSVEKLAARFKSEAVREAFSLIIPLQDFPVLYVLSLFAALDAKEAGWPQGGSLALAQSVEKRYRELGGTIHYGARVAQILVENGRAAGVRLADGSEHRADMVISAADGHTTLFGMLNGRYVPHSLKKLYETMPLYKPLMQVSFGLKRDLSGEPRLTTYGFSPAMRFGGTEVPFVFLNNYGFDPTLAPAGCSALTLLFWSPFDHWEKLYQDRDRYSEEKKRVAEDATCWLESIYPGIRGDIEVVDVSTPMTTVRYTGNWHASYEGWRPTAATMRTKIPNTLPGLKGFKMIGQWTRPFAGLPTAVLDGRIAVELLCREDGKTFVTSAA